MREVERADVEEEALKVLNNPHDTVYAVDVWSVIEQQFAWSYLKFKSGLPEFEEAPHGMAEGQTPRSEETEAADYGARDGGGTRLVAIAGAPPNVPSEAPKRRRGRPPKSRSAA